MSNNDPIRQYTTFLYSKYSAKGSGNVSHTILAGVEDGKPVEKGGSFNIDDDNYAKFMNLYQNVVGRMPLRMVERPLPVGPMVIDIDFNQTSPKRQYTKDDILAIIKIYVKLFCDHLDINPSRCDCLIYVLEKEAPTLNKKKGSTHYKDGFHVIFADLPVNVKLRYYFYQKAIEIAIKKNIYNHLDLTNEMTDIIDPCVIKNNGILMFGSYKYKCQPYYLSYLYDMELNSHDISVVDEKELPTILSLRRYNEDVEVKLSKKILNDKNIMAEIDDINAKYAGGNKMKDNAPTIKHEQKCTIEIDEDGGFSGNLFNKLEKLEKNKFDDKFKEFDKPKSKLSPEYYAKSREVITSTCNNVTNGKKRNKEDIDYAIQLTKLLSSERASSYLPWLHVGWALHNISDTLFDTYDEFSQKSDRYNDNGNKELMKRNWEKARNTGFGLPSLILWAKTDNIKAYNSLVSKRIETLIRKAIASETEDDVANVIAEIYKSSFKCTSIKNKTWYEFKVHRWVESEEGLALAEKMSGEVYEMFKEVVMLTENSEKEKKKEDLQAKYKRGDIDEDEMIRAIKGFKDDAKKKISGSKMRFCNKLKGSTFRKNVISMCAVKMLDDKFEDILDSNTHLIGFNNGVYDLKRGMFRDGIPEDNITLSVGYDYIESHLNDPMVIKFRTFIAKAHQMHDMQEYLLRFIASCLDGEPLQLLNMWTGTGSNGKSKMIEFMKYLMGKYYGTLPITILTRKAGSASSATPEMANKRGVRLIVFNEPEHNEIIHVGRMKELTGGDDIYARPLYKPGFIFKPQANFLIICNKLPPLGSVDGGVTRRIRAVPWETTFVDKHQPCNDAIYDIKGMLKTPKQFRKENMPPEMLKEMAPHAMWLLLSVYYPQYVKIQLCEPERIKCSTDKYKKDCDPYIEYMMESLSPCKDKDNEIKLTELYKGFGDFYRAAYGKPPPPRKDFINFLTESPAYNFDGRNIRGWTMGADEEKNDNNKIGRILDKDNHSAGGTAEKATTTDNSDNDSDDSDKKKKKKKKMRKFNDVESDMSSDDVSSNSDNEIDLKKLKKNKKNKRTKKSSSSSNSSSNDSSSDNNSSNDSDS